jgi:hypothetical protein
VTQPPAAFGRRGAPGRARPVSDNAASTPDGPNPTPADQLRGQIGKMLVIIPSVLVLSFLMVFMITHARSTSGSSSGFACRSEKAAGSVFDIDWCRAGAAALQGAARGVAGGVANRP